MIMLFYKAVVGSLIQEVSDTLFELEDMVWQFLNSWCRKCFNETVYRFQNQKLYNISKIVKLVRDMIFNQEIRRCCLEQVN